LYKILSVVSCCLFQDAAGSIVLPVADSCLLQFICFLRFSACPRNKQQLGTDYNLQQAATGTVTNSQQAATDRNFELAET